MDKEELIKIISEKRKGRMPAPREQAEILDAALEVGKSMLQKLREIDEDKKILADLNTQFPVIYREAKRIFNLKPQKTEEHG